MNVLGYYEQALRQREMRGFGDFLEDERASRAVYKGEGTTVLSPVASISFYSDGSLAAVGQEAADYLSAGKTWKWAAILGIPLALVAGGIVARKLL